MKTLFLVTILFSSFKSYSLCSENSLNIFSQANYNQFGKSLARSNNQLFVSMPGEFAGQGQVYIFTKNLNGQWGFNPFTFPQVSPTTILNPPQSFLLGNGVHFGLQLVANDQHLVVSGRRINGTTGAVYVYRKNQGAWVLNQQLIPPYNVGAGHLYGADLAMWDDFVFVGNTITSSSESGKVEVFKKMANGQYLHHQTLQKQAASPQQSMLLLNDHFGKAITAENGLLVVGASKSYMNGSSGGIAVTFKYDPSRPIGQQWNEINNATLVSPQTEFVSYATDLQLKNGNLIVGSDDGPYFYSWNETIDQWDSMDSFPVQINMGSGYGSSIALSDQFALIGAPSYDHTTGAGVLFKLHGGRWNPVKILRSDPNVQPTLDRGARLGSSTFFMDNHAILGAPFPTNLSSTSQGQLRFFNTESTCLEIGQSFCSSGVIGNTIPLPAGGPGQFQKGRIKAEGETSLSENRVIISARNLPPNMNAFVFASRIPQIIIHPNGSLYGQLCLANPANRLSAHQALTNANGEFSVTLNPLEFPIHTRPNVGDTVYFQIFYRDSPPWNSNFTDAVEIQFTP